MVTITQRFLLIVIKFFFNNSLKKWKVIKFFSKKHKKTDLIFKKYVMFAIKHIFL